MSSFTMNVKMWPQDPNSKTYHLETEKSTNKTGKISLESMKSATLLFNIIPPIWL